MKEKPFFDSNIFVYAADKKSLFHNESVEIIKDCVEKGFFTADICFLEFYQVITDGRKTPRPLSPEETLLYIQKLWNTPEIHVLETDIFDLFEGKSHQDNLVKHNVTRFDIYDYLIAACLKKNHIKEIVTFNSKDFEKYPWITVIDPREYYGSRSSAPSAKRFIPYARQSIDEKDVAAVCSVLRSDWLTTGPKVAEFEKSLAEYVGTKYAVAVSSGTAALHAAMYAIVIGPGDEVIVPPMTFAATANCVVFQGGTPVFTDVDPDTLLLDPSKAEEKITEKTRAIIGVDYAGQPCDWDMLREIADKYGLRLVADGCHALGAEYKGCKVGSLADMTVFSFHPVKHITTGEGGMITTDDPELAGRMRLFRNHGITTDHRQREEQGSWFYEMADLGYNYRITDFQCALGISQLRKLPKFPERRRKIAARYDEAFADLPGINPLVVCPDVLHAYHLYVVRVDPDALGIDRDSFFANLREKGIGVNVHYIPVHLHPFYRKKFLTGPGLCHVAEAAYEQIISLPMFPGMTDADVKKVINVMQEVILQNRDK